jgi:hypothetical protein
VTVGEVGIGDGDRDGDRDGDGAADGDPEGDADGVGGAACELRVAAGAPKPYQIPTTLTATTAANAAISPQPRPMAALHHEIPVRWGP